MPEPVEAYFRSREALLGFRAAFLAEDIAGMEALLSEVTPEGLPDLQSIVATQKVLAFEERIRALPLEERLAKTTWAFVQEYNKQGGGKELSYEKLPIGELGVLSALYKIIEETGGAFDSVIAKVERMGRETELESQLYRVGTETVRVDLQRFYDSSIAPRLTAYSAKPRERNNGIAPIGIMNKRFPTLDVTIGTDTPQDTLNQIRTLAERHSYEVVIMPRSGWQDVQIKAKFE